MKKLNLFFMAMTMLFMAASLTACSDDDNNGGTCPLRNTSR